MASNRQILRVECLFRLFFFAFFTVFKLRPVCRVFVHLFRAGSLRQPTAAERFPAGWSRRGHAMRRSGRYHPDLKTRNGDALDRHRYHQFCSPPGRSVFTRTQMLAMAESAGIRPARASTINSTTSASSSASRDCSAMRVSTPSSVPSIPPVSIQMNSRPSTSARPYLRSRVSPGKSTRQPAHHGCVLNG